MKELYNAIQSLKSIEEEIDKTSYSIGILLENGGTSVADVAVVKDGEKEENDTPIDFKKLLKKKKSKK